jgi:hypothetical protein
MAKLFHMLGVTVDPADAKAKNWRVTPEDRTRIGKKLRALRGDRRQVDVVAAMPKGYRISLGTLQAIEGYWYDVRIENVEIYAAFFDTSVTALLREDEPRPLQPTDPLLQDLHEEHLEIAQRYMRARNPVRACVEVLLDDRRAFDPNLTTILLQLATWSAADLALAAPAFAQAALIPAHVLAHACHRLATDPEFLMYVDRLATQAPPEEADGPAHAQGKPK